MKYNILFLLAFLSFSVWSQRSPMNQNEIESLKKSVVAKNQEIKTIKTQFTQAKHLSFLSNDIYSSGEMILQTPARLLWKYTDPFEYSIRFTENKIYIDDQGKKHTVEAGNHSVFSKINQLIASSISGDVFTLPDFKFQFFKETNHRIVVLIPTQKELQGFIHQVELYFTPDAIVSEVKLVETSEDYTHIVFKNQRINEKVDDAIFRF